ncbi:tetrachloroethene dehalogenase [Photobacterium lipolyticum]|uniref:Tetrachloroethene dehalogenase n=1 Tax=Photobacterium lipolyticum TaxID=266810 RepID=A0A2T3N2S3_9GAMM|nr:tetrachloroethene dehalogenase [Photobacterium lipolyticum]PSW06554.1 tetrachloroethene dehalogenase [Photobacterium lipolyticum]
MIGLMWYLMGMATTAALWGYVYLKRSYQLGLMANLGLLGAFGLGWICIGWSWASFAEGEPQSGAMGMLCFGLPTLILAAVTWRKLIQPAIK